MTILGTIRFLVGAALVAAGASLVAPLAARLAVAARSAHAPVLNPGPPAPVPVGAPAPAAPVTVAPPTDPAQADWDVARAPAWVDAAGTLPDSGGGLQLDYSPPPPPAPLPLPPEELVQAAPTLGAAYRSTLDVPPPPLLDAASAPPGSLTWATPGMAAATADVVGKASAAHLPDATVPATYRVVDGDDLGTIAGRFYGHPAAASAIWAANRDALADPAVLPIGMELRLPPPWAARGTGHMVAGAIEPVAYTRPLVPPPAAAGPQPAAHAVPWLAPAGPNAAAGPAPPAALPAPTARSVRVASGETLGSLARRLYGDPGMAAEIFAANRDRLRSPDLVVPGMELRLPRPVTVPRS